MRFNHVEVNASNSYAVHNLNTGLNYTTIQEAIDASETQDGHTIFVETGTYYENVVVNKTLSLVGEDSSTTIIDGSGFGHVVIISSDDVDLSGFTVQNSGTAYHITGINLNNVNHCNISGNIVTNNEHGLELHNLSYYNIISGNIITENNKWGLHIIDSHYNNVSGNIIGGSLWGSIAIHGFSTYNRIFGNNVGDNDNGGISIDGSDYNDICENNITNNLWGISVQYGARYNAISRNNITNNNYSFKLEWNTYANMFYHNNLVGNAFPVSIVGYNYANSWDYGYPSGGNYWSDYTGVDVKKGSNQNLHGSDGRGDTPYIIDANNRDRYPLMNPFSSASPPTYILTITQTAGETTDPSPGTYSYTANSSVQVTAIPAANYLFDYWELDGAFVGSANPYTILMDKNHTLKAVFSLVPPQLSATISPLSSSILVGQYVIFTSTVSGGCTPYSYQWYLNGNPFSGATSPSWTFTPTTAGIYYVYLKVTDAEGNPVQSDAACMTVATVPVGGYSVLIQQPTTTKPVTLHITLLTIITAIFTTIKRKTKRKR
jgi:parallel beta-helix repeat protein